MSIPVLGAVIYTYAKAGRQGSTSHAAFASMHANDIEAARAEWIVKNRGLGLRDVRWVTTMMWDQGSGVRDRGVESAMSS